ncbi:MAG: FAD:protein FMN transferase [Sedimentisphaerales bacterium]|jgi:thiamine biosynthesis lipoprotein
MAQQQPDTISFEKDRCGIANLRKFRHNAMAATFEIFIVHHDAVYAEQAAWAAFEELDRIEGNLSRFIENSDVSRINSLAAGQSLQLGLTAFECLQTSVEMSVQTKGAFDITIGPLYDCWLDKDRTPRKPSKKNLDAALKKTGNKFLVLDESEHTVVLRTDGVRIDFGAIGKGYAADKIAQLLGEWGIKVALISAGQSTILPVGIPAGLPGWPISLSDPADYSRLIAKIHLSGRAISASGLRKGQHIINPRSGKPVTRPGAWSMAKTAAEADALSTAFMVMPVNAVRSFCEKHKGTSALLVLSGKSKKTGSRILRFGRWGKAKFYSK